MFINWQLRQINLKIVYYGPALSGKTTNLEQIHARIDPTRRSDLVSLKTYEDRTLYFDFLQLELGKINGLTPKIQLYTVPGQAFYEASRRLVLRGADGVVFVADSGSNPINDNIDSWQNMTKHLISFELDPTRMPIIVQLNKQDLPNALPIPFIQNMLNCQNNKTIPAVANVGQGVFDTLKMIISGVVVNIRKKPAKGPGKMMALSPNFSIVDLQSYLNEIQASGDFNQIILTDEQGLIICSSGDNVEESENHAAMFSMLQKISGTAVAEMKLSATTEFALTDTTGKKLIVRPFSANGSELILAFQLKRHNSAYKRLMGSMVRTIQTVWKI